MNLRPLLLLCLAGFLLGQTQAKAQEASDKLVEIRTMDSAYATYKERRETHGFLFGVSFENYYPSEYTSLADGATYSDMFANNPVPLVGLELGYKFNFSLGSLAAIYGYAYGTKSDNLIGEDRNLEMHRNSLKVMYIMDALFDEPYVAPYVGFGVMDFGIDEKVPAADGSYSGQSQLGNLLTAGLLIQLNWLEPFSARDGYMTAGLENTYLDLFMTQHSKAATEENPSLSSDFDWGVGLRLEF